MEFKHLIFLVTPNRQNTPDNARAGWLTWWGFVWTRWWSSRSVCPSLYPSVRWSCSRLRVRSYEVYSCHTLPFYQLPVLIYNTDLPYCVCDEILFNLNSCPSMRESSQSSLKTIQEMRSFFSIGREAFVFGFTPLDDV